jgi:hypothetical protein
MEYINNFVSFWFIFCMGLNLFYAERSEGLESIRFALLAILYAILLMPMIAINQGLL